MIPNMKPVINGPLGQDFNVTHNPENDWATGGVSPNHGIIAPAGKDAAKFLPEGTRLSQAITIFAGEKIGFGDRVPYLGLTYSVVHLQDYSQYGYYYAVAALPDGPANPDSPGFIDV